MKRILCITLFAILNWQNTYSQTFTDSIFCCDIMDQDSTCVTISLNDKLDREQKKNLRVLTIPSIIHHNDNVFKVEALSEYGFSGNCDIHEIIIEEGVKTISKGCFSNNLSLEKITIPSSTHTIEEGILSNCNQLTSIIVDGNNQYYDSRDNCNAIIESASNKIVSGCNNTIIPSSLQSIGKRAFSSCFHIKSVNLPEGLLTIECESFLNCINLQEIVIPESCVRIDGDSFKGCQSLEAVSIPQNVSVIDYNPFTNSPKLQKITVDGRNKCFDSREGCNAIIRSNIHQLVAGCQATVIPDDVTQIEMFAFAGTPFLSEVHIGKNIQKIDNGAFANVLCIKKIIVSEENKQYDSRDQSNCIIETKSNRVICGGLGFKIPQTATSIANYAFFGSILPECFYLPDNIEKIGYFAFAYSLNMKKLIIPSSVSYIGTQAFKGCHELQSVEIDSNNISIGAACFEGCTNLSGIYMKEGIKTLPEFLFSGCSSLKHFYFPSSVGYIMHNTFEGCPYKSK